MNLFLHSAGDLSQWLVPSNPNLQDAVNMQGPQVAGIILAAGKGTRMKSDLPKGLHRVCGIPMVEHVGRSLKEAGVEKPIVVVGHGGEAMLAALEDSAPSGYAFVWQREQLGTGHAALMAAPTLKDY